MHLDDPVPAATPRQETPEPATQAVSEVVPDHAHTVVVPIANPQTAAELLVLARAVVRADGGKVIGLVVILGDADAEQNMERVEALRAVVDDTTDERDDIAIELLTRPAASISRGILDVAVDEGADMILLGVQAPTPGEVAIGGVAESVIDAAQCDVLIYRRGRHGSGLEGLDGIVVPVEGSEASRVAARLAIILGQGLRQPVEVLHVRRPGETAEQADLAIERSLRDVADAETCRRTTVNAAGPARGMRSAVGADTLAVVGFENVLRYDGRYMGATSMAALNTLRGPVLAVSRPTRTTGADAWIRRLSIRLRPRLTDVEEESLIWQARLQATTTPDYIVMCILSALIAAFGLLLDSAAVIIGAMLVAPLMSPLIAFGTTMVDGDIATLRRALGTIGIGSALVGGTALLVGLVIGPDVPTSEMASRGSPSLIDAGVAVASGAVGAYASARKGIPAALAGVAIAAALVPPIGVFGLALTTDARLATGSGLLFLTNIVCIAVAGAGTLLWLGLRVDHASTGARPALFRAATLVVVVVLGALVLFGVTTGPADLDGIRDVVEEEVAGIEVVAVDERGPDGVVTVTVRAEEAPAASDVRRAIDRVAQEHRDLELRLVVQELVTGG